MLAISTSIFFIIFHLVKIVSTFTAMVTQINFTFFQCSVVYTLPCFRCDLSSTWIFVVVLQRWCTSISQKRLLSCDSWNMGIVVVSSHETPYRTIKPLYIEKTQKGTNKLFCNTEGTLAIYANSTDGRFSSVGLTIRIKYIPVNENGGAGGLSKLPLNANGDLESAPREDYFHFLCANNIPVNGDHLRNENRTESI